MGGCSSKPQTTDCNDGLLQPPASLHLLLQATAPSPPQATQRTLKSLFNQHGRDGEDLLGDPQTLHELLLISAVDAKELPGSDTQSTGNTEGTIQISAPCEPSSPVSVLCNRESRSTERKGTLPDVMGANEESRDILHSLVSNSAQVTEENTEKCKEDQKLAPIVAEVRHQDTGVAHLEGFLSRSEEGQFVTLEATRPDFSEGNVDDSIKAQVSPSITEQENQGSFGTVEGSVSDLADVKPKEECTILTSMLSSYAEEKASKSQPESPLGSLNVEEPASDSPKPSEYNSSDCAEYELRGIDLVSKSEPSLSKSTSADPFQKMLVSNTEESKSEAEVQALADIAMKDETKGEATNIDMLLEAQMAHEQDPIAVACEKNADALQHVEAGDQLQKCIEKNMVCEKDNMQDGKELETVGDNATTGMQNETAYDGELIGVQADNVEDEKANGMEKLERSQHAREGESQDERKAGVRKEAGEETKVQHEEMAEIEETAMAKESPAPVKAENEEAMAMADVSSSNANERSECALGKHGLEGSSFEPLNSCGGQSIAGIEYGSISELAPEENTIEAGELGCSKELNEYAHQKPAFEEDTKDVVAKFVLAEKHEGDLTKLASDGNITEAVESVGGHATHWNTLEALDEEHPEPGNYEQMHRIGGHGKSEHDAVSAPQHSEADKLDCAKAAMLEEESYMEAENGNGKLYDNEVAERDDKVTSELCADEETKVVEEQGTQAQTMHYAHAHDGSQSCVQKNLPGPAAAAGENIVDIDPSSPEKSPISVPK